MNPDELFGLDTIIGPFQDINVEFGRDAESENMTFAPDKKLLVVGPNFHVDIPAGCLNIGVHVSKEWNNGYAGRAISFAPAPEFDCVWPYPLTLTGLPLDIRGFMNVILPKGNDGFGNNT